MRICRAVLFTIAVVLLTLVAGFVAVMGIDLFSFLPYDEDLIRLGAGEDTLICFPVPLDPERCIPEATCPAIKQDPFKSFDQWFYALACDSEKWRRITYEVLVVDFAIYALALFGLRRLAVATKTEEKHHGGLSVSFRADPRHRVHVDEDCDRLVEDV